MGVQTAPGAPPDAGAEVLEAKGGGSLGGVRVAWYGGRPFNSYTSAYIPLGAEVWGANVGVALGGVRVA